jgi:cytochrome c oxidase subunit 2
VDSIGTWSPPTTQAALLRSDWLVFLWTGLAVAALVYGLIFYALLRWRRRGAELPRQFRRNNRLEVAYTVVPLVMVAVLFGVTYAVERPVESVSAHPDLVVRVVAYRWGWQFTYPGQRITLDSHGSSAGPQLVLPVDRTTRIEITSVDVTHGFWIPAFLFKRDAIPGLLNRFDLRPDRIGTFYGTCSQFCGLHHALMHFSLRVVPDAEFARWAGSAASAT